MARKGAKRLPLPSAQPAPITEVNKEMSPPPAAATAVAPVADALPLPSAGLPVEGLALMAGSALADIAEDNASPEVSMYPLICRFRPQFLTII